MPTLDPRQAHALARERLSANGTGFVLARRDPLGHVQFLTGRRSWKTQLSSARIFRSDQFALDFAHAFHLSAEILPVHYWKLAS